MERKKALSLLNMCRFCLCPDSDSLSSIYEKERKKDYMSLQLKILNCLGVEVFPSDQMPTLICDRCRFFISLFNDYKQLSRKADNTLYSYKKMKSNISPICWPSSLLETFAARKSVTKRGIIKTVVEGGATVEVTTEDGLSDEDDDDGDENVYNVKIDGSGMDDDTQISIVPSRDNLKNAKGISKRLHKDYVTISPSRRPQSEVIASAGASREKMIPCKYCDKMFHKAAFYVKHLTMKHPAVAGSALREYQAELSVCPICNESAPDMEMLVTHVKSHVNGMDFLCALCDTVFASKEKMETHMQMDHSDEMENDESSIEIEDDGEDINVREVGGEMVVEIKKANSFMLSNIKTEDENFDNAHIKENKADTCENTMQAAKSAPSTPSQNQEKTMNANIVRKAEDVKQKAKSQIPDTNEKTMVKAEGNNSIGANDKSLKLLEKELQELKRTNPRTELKVVQKSLEPTRGKRIQQIHNSAPKQNREEKKLQTSSKAPVEKKLLERRNLTKENKEPKEKEIKTSATNIKEEKEQTIPKSVEKTPVNVNNNNSDEMLRRSRRSTKVKDYANSKTEESDENESGEENDEDFDLVNSEKNNEKPKVIKVVNETPPEIGKRKRGRPRKDAQAVITKMKKVEEVCNTFADTSENENNSAEEKTENSKSSTVTPEKIASPSTLLVSPSGQPIKKMIPIRALPPGIKALPLPSSVQTQQSPQADVCEMHIGKKLVKVQKIVMSKAEVEAMTKQGLLEMKDGTMVLKPGVKLPTADSRPKLTAEDAGGDSNKLVE